MLKKCSFLSVMFLILGLFMLVSGSIAMEADLEAAKNEKEVVLWATGVRNEEHFLSGFKHKYPFLKVKIWNSYSTPLANKLIEESRAGRHSVDVVFTSLRQMPRLKNAKAITEYAWPAKTNHWPAQPEHNYWRNVTTQLFIPTYNTNLLPRDKAPKSWKELKDWNWKKGQAIVSSSGASAPLMFAYLWRHKDGSLNWDVAFDYWKEVITKSKPQVGSGFKGPTELLAGGSYEILLLNVAGDAFLFQKKGAPIEFLPVEKAIGSMRSISRPTVVPHPNASALLIDYLLSDEGLVKYCDAHGIPPLDPNLQDKSEAGKKLKELGIEYEVLPAEFQSREYQKKATSWWTTQLGVRRGTKR